MKNILWVIENSLSGNIDGDHEPDLQRILAARQELFDMQRKKNVLVITQTKGRWAFAYNEDRIKELVAAIEVGCTENWVLELLKAWDGLQLISRHRYDPSLYSEIIII